MSVKHRDPEYRRNARIIRQQVAALRRRGEEVMCWRCGGEIAEGQPWDVGHINPNGGHGLSNLAPEHRYRTGKCRGNRSAGGAIGQARRQARDAVRLAPARPTSGPRPTGLLGWIIAHINPPRTGFSF